MPFISEELRDCAVYLYPSVKDANDGAHAGGTGFLVGVPANTVKDFHHIYAVSNEHVIRPPSGAPNPVVRLNTIRGGTRVVDVPLDDWLPHPDGDDVAVSAIQLNATEEVHWIDRGTFLNPDDLSQHHIGPGDDCFMIGRFIYNDGRLRNEPVLRFGNISMLPQPIYQPARGRDQESFIVEMRSLSGFSGAPVIVHYVTVGSRSAPSVGGVAFASLVTNQAWLLGIDWGSLPAIPNLLGDQGDRTQLNSGMAAVVPAWILAELLDRDELVRTRNEREQIVIE